MSLLGGCTMDTIRSVQDNAQDEEELVTETLRIGVGADTKATIDSDGDFSWEEGDVVLIPLMKNGVFSRYVEGTVCQESNDWVVKFLRKGTEHAEGLAYYMAYYPTNLEAVIENIYLPGSYCIAPPEEGGASDVIMPMTAIINDGDTGVAFYHTAGLLRLCLNNVPAATAGIEVVFPDGTNVVGAFSATDERKINEETVGYSLSSCVSGGDNKVQYSLVNTHEAMLAQANQSNQGVLSLLGMKVQSNITAKNAYRPLILHQLTSGIVVDVPLPAGDYSQVTVRATRGIENVTAAESRIRDTDMADEMTKASQTYVIKNCLASVDVDINNWTCVAGKGKKVEVTFPEEEEDYTNAAPLTLEAVNDNTTVTIANPLADDYQYVLYKINDASSWKVKLLDEYVITLNAGDKLRLAGYADAYAAEETVTVENDGEVSTRTHVDHTSIQCSDDCYVYGNIMSLIDKDSFSTITTLTASRTFESLFAGNEHIIHDPDGHGELVLPATTLAERCYTGMFLGCSKLGVAPALPATDLTGADKCYFLMLGATNIDTPPALPAEVLSDRCYRMMFWHCHNLASFPALPATTLADGCYDSMFYGCYGLTLAPEDLLPAETAKPYCYARMFEDCINLRRAPRLPATTLAGYCYSHMFYGCKKLTNAPELYAETLVEGCYAGLFKDCEILQDIECYATDISASDCTASWVENVAETGLFKGYWNTWTKLEGDNIVVMIDNDHIPAGWNRILSIPTHSGGSND